MKYAENGVSGVIFDCINYYNSFNSYPTGNLTNTTQLNLFY